MNGIYITSIICGTCIVLALIGKFSKKEGQ